MRENYQPKPELGDKTDKVMNQWEKLQFVYELKLQGVLERLPDAPGDKYQELKEQRGVLEQAIATLEEYNSATEGDDKNGLETKVREAVDSVTSIL